MFSTGLVSVTRGRESNVLRQRENKTLNTPTGKGKLKKRARSYFSFSKTKYSLHPKLHFAGRSESSPVCSPECHPVNARQSLCFSASQQVCSHVKDWRSKEHKGWEEDVVLNKTMMTNIASAKPTGLGRKCLPLLPTTRRLQQVSHPLITHLVRKSPAVCSSVQMLTLDVWAYQFLMRVLFAGLIINPVGKAGSLCLQKTGLAFQKVSASVEPKPSFSRASENASTFYPQR